MEYQGLVHYEIFIMTIYIVCFIIILHNYCLQVKSLFYNILMPSNSIFLITTTIDNKFELSARFYQVILALRKLIFAILIVKGINNNQVLIFSLLLLFQIAWLSYLIMFSPLRYRFANITCWVNEAALVFILLLTLLKAAKILERESYYVYIQIMLRLPLGTIFITLYFIAFSLQKGFLRSIRLRIFPYKFYFMLKIGFKRIEVYDEFGKFHPYVDTNDQTKDQNQTKLLNLKKGLSSKCRSKIN